MVDLGFALNYEVKLLQRNKTVSENQVMNFKREAIDFLAKMCSHLI